jgi:hypothetical protein
VERSLVMRIHNRHNYECGCDPDCWCQRTAIGRLVKWWVKPRYARLLGFPHVNRALEEWKRTHGENSLREWKRRQHEA